MVLTKLEKYALIIIPLLFLFYSAPSALDYIFFHADEKRYTDAVIHMMDKDECFTPFKADGETPRFKKPIITYWALMGGFKLFGVSPFGARFFFWIAGALLVALTYLMSNSLFQNKKISVLAAFIVAANPLVMMSASRSIPDILLVLFLTTSAWGFLEIMIREKTPKKFYWMAYLGAALAFETKGIPAAAFAVASILFLLLNPWKRVQLKKLIAPAAIPVSVVIALSWYILMVVQHGNTFVDTFFADQVGDRVSSKLTQILTNGILGILNLFLFFIPWVILFLSKPGQLKKEIVKSKTNVKAILGFVASWVVLIVLMSASVFKFYDRYILPCIPLVALVLAYSIVNFNTAFRKPVFKVFAGINLAVLLIALLYLLFISQNAVLILGVVAGLVLNILYFLGIFRKISKEILIANAVMLIYFTGHILLYPLLMPVPAKQLVVSFKEHLEHEKDPVYVYGHIGIPANVRVQGHAELNIISMDTVYVLPETPNHIIAFKEKEKQRLNLENYDIYPGSEEWSDVPAGKFPPFLRKPVENLKNRGTKYFIGKPKQ